MISWWTQESVRIGVQGTVLAGVVFLITRVFSALKPSTKALLWWLVLAHFAFAWIFAFSVRVGNENNVVASAPAAIEQLVEPGSQALVSDGASLQTPDRGTSAFDTPGVWRQRLPMVAFGIWLLGGFVVFIRGAYGVWLLARIRHEARVPDEKVLIQARQLSAELGLPAAPTVLETGGISAPATFGVFKPCVLLPISFSTLSEEEQEMALVHELAHIARHDLQLVIAAELAVILFWFLPPVYFVRREWSIERELACDSVVVDRTGDGQGYRRLLLRIIGKDSISLPRAAMGATADFRCLRRRLLAKFTNKNPRFGFVGICCTLAVVALAVPVRFQPSESTAGLVKDASFENGSGNLPVAWISGQRLDGVHYVWDDTVAHTGSRSISIQKQTQRYFPIAEWTQTLLYDGKSPAIDFKGWVKADHMYKAVLDVQFATSEGIATHQWVAFVGAKKFGDPPETFDWKQMGGQAKIPAGTKQIILSFQCYGPGKVWLDDVSANYVSSETQSESHS